MQKDGGAINWKEEDWKRNEFWEGIAWAKSWSQILDLDAYFQF